MIKFPFHLHRSSKDQDGEVTLTIKVPQSHAVLALNLPTNMILTATVTKDTTDESHSDTDTGASL